MRTLSPSRRGFSLLELVVAIGIFALFTLTLSRLMMGGMQTFKRGAALTSLRQDLRQAMDLISADFRQSTVTSMTSPAYASGTNKTLILTFQRSTSSTDHTVTYTIDATTNRLTRADVQDAQTLLVANNILVGSKLGETVAADLSQSYFVWAQNPNTDNTRDYGTLEVRLTGMNQEQKMSMVTQVTQRQDIDLASNPLPPYITLLPPADVRPVAPRWIRSSGGTF